MSGWKDYSQAPVAGAIVANLHDVEEGASTLELDTGKGPFPILLVRKKDSVMAYVNACPHQFLPLDYRGKGILSANGLQLICTAHGAMFDRETGQGTTADVEGCALDAIPIDIDENQQITIGG